MNGFAKPIVLVIEDDESTRWLLGMYLQRLSVEVDVFYASTAGEGKKILTADRVDLVICDYNMSGGYGTEVLEYLRDTKSKLPFILYTSEELNRIPHVSYLRFSYIQKPNADLLMDEIERLFQK